MRTRVKLVKKSETTEVKTFKCVVVDMCAKCASQCNAQPAEAASATDPAGNTDVTLRASDKNGVSAALASMITGEIRRRRDARDLKEDLQVWEGEGGQIPGATLGAPAAHPPADHPLSYPPTHAAQT